MIIGNCADNPEVMFPEGVGRGIYNEARKLCSACPVIQACGQEVMRKSYSWYQHGFMAGMTPDQRRELKGLVLPGK